MLDRKPSMRDRFIFDMVNAARQANIHVRHFRRIIEEEQIPTFEINNKLFILKTELDKWIAQRPPRQHRRKPGTERRAKWAM